MIKKTNYTKVFHKKQQKNGSIGFLLNIKSHTINTRNQNNYQESHCNTQILLQSDIPQMQILLNIYE